MEIKPKFGTDQLLFGMKQTDVKNIFGNPDKQFKDDDQNIIYVYNAQKMRLTFYEDEDFRFGLYHCFTSYANVIWRSGYRKKSN